MKANQDVSLIVFGEVLFDCFPDGQKVLGGAPFNVAWALQGFGCEPLLLTSVGDDSLGRGICERMTLWGMRLDGVGRSKTKRTGEVVVTFDGQEPSYEICEDRAWDLIEVGELGASVLIYHGLLALRGNDNRAALKALLGRSDARRFFDLNLRPPFDDLALAEEWIQGVDWLKLNLDELGVLLGETRIQLECCDLAVKSIMSRWSISNVLITGGATGARIFSEDSSVSCMPAPSVDKFVDAVGAGDGFSASLIRSILAGENLSHAIKLAGGFAAKICSLRGATSDERDFYQVGV